MDSNGGERPPSPGRRSGWDEAEGSLIRGTPVRVESSPDNDGLVGTARRPGPGKPDGKVYVRNQRSNASQFDPPARTWRIWAGQRHNSVAIRSAIGTPRPVDIAGRGGHEESLRRTRGWLQGHSWAPTLSIDSVVNVGTVPAHPVPVWGGQARRLPVASVRGGAAVLVRAGKARYMAKGGSRFAAEGLEGREVDGEYRRAVAGSR
jgi:hypothetical protein